VTFEQKNDFPEMLKPDLLDGIHVANSHTNVATNYVVQSVRHTVSFNERGTQHMVEFGATLQVNST
jgi:hypothetical protein